MIADDVGRGTALQTGESFYFSFVLGFTGFIVGLPDASGRVGACARRIRFNLVDLDRVASFNELLRANGKDILRAEDLIVKLVLLQGDGEEDPLPFGDSLEELVIRWRIRPE